MAGEHKERHSGDPLQSGDAYKKKNFNRIWLMMFGLTVLIVIGYLIVAHLYFSGQNSVGAPRSGPGTLLILRSSGAPPSKEEPNARDPRGTGLHTTRRVSLRNTA